MNDKNKIKILEIPIDNLIKVKNKNDMERSLSKLGKKNRVDNKNNVMSNVMSNVNLNIGDIILGLLLIVSLFSDFKKMCNLNTSQLLILIVMFICISLFIKPNCDILGFTKILLGMSIILIIYFEKKEYFDFYVFKIVLCVVGLYMIYNSFSNNTNIKNEKKQPDYINKFLQLKIESGIKNEKNYEGGEIKGCINIDTINNDKSENKVFCKGGVYNLGKLIIDNRNLLNAKKILKKKYNNTDFDLYIDNRHILSQGLLLLSDLKKNNNNGDLLFLLEILLTDKRTYTNMKDVTHIYTKEYVVKIMETILNDEYLMGYICFNNISV